MSHPTSPQPAPTEMALVSRGLLKEARDNAEASCAESGVSHGRLEYRKELVQRLDAALIARTDAVLPEPVDLMQVTWRGDREFARPVGDYYTADQMRAYAAVAIADFLQRTGQYVTNDATRDAALTDAYAEGRKDEAEESARLKAALDDAWKVLRMVDDNNRAEAGEPVKSWRGSFVVEEVRRVLSGKLEDYAKRPADNVVRLPNPATALLSDSDIAVAAANFFHSKKGRSPSGFAQGASWARAEIAKTGSTELIGQALMCATDRLDFDALERSHCNSMAKVRRGLAAYAELSGNLTAARRAGSAIPTSSCPHDGQCHPGFCPCSDKRRSQA